jgi:ABC-type transporter Mla MlaB component
MVNRLSGMPAAAAVPPGRDEIAELCRRILAAHGEPVPVPAHPDQLERIAAAVRACRSRARRGTGSEATSPVAAQPPASSATASPQRRSVSLAEAVAAELSVANGKLPPRQREALALRELLGLTHAEIAGVLELDTAAVAALLARSRLSLRAQLRGAAVDLAGCNESERALRLLARRQDGEDLAPEEEEWIGEHMAGCSACDGAHAAMFEAAVCYRGWDPGAP